LPLFQHRFTWFKSVAIGTTSTAGIPIRPRPQRREFSHRTRLCRKS